MFSANLKATIKTTQITKIRIKNTIYWEIKKNRILKFFTKSIDKEIVVDFNLIHKPP